MKISDAFKTLKLKAYKNRGDIAFFGGMGMTAVGTGLFVRSTIKNRDNVDNYNEIKAQIESEDLTDDERSSKLKDLRSESLTTTVKNYAVPVAVSAAGYGLEIYGHQSVKSDLVAVSVALNGMTAAYEALKAKIIENDGNDKWAEYTGITYDHDGNMVLPVIKTPHEHLFYEPHVNWSPNKGANKAFLLGKWNELEHKLSKTWVLLEYQALDILGYDAAMELKAGNVSLTSGWVYNPNIIGEHQIDMGFDAQDDATRLFWDEVEPSFLIRFNCVDNVYDYI